MTFTLSDRAKELIPKARIVSLAGLQGRYDPEAIARFQQADDAGQYLRDEDLVGMMPAPAFVVQLLREGAAAIVTQAREQVLAQYPGITEPGGALYPALRAEACWRDFWHFLRCVTYGIAGELPEFTSAEGLGYMNLLYQELQVPLPAMVTGLEALKKASIQYLVATELEPEHYVEVAPYFDHLLEKLRQFTA